MTQTSTEAQTPDTGPMFPRGRYGRRRDPRPARRRWVTPLIGLVILAVMALITVKLYFEYGSGDFSPSMIGSSNITDTSITVAFDVTKSNGEGGTCTVQAFTFDDSLVGEAQVPIPAAGTSVKITYTLLTSAKAYIAEVPACQPS